MWSVHCDGVQLQQGGGLCEARGSQCLSGSTVQCGWDGRHYSGGYREHSHSHAPSPGQSVVSLS